MPHVFLDRDGRSIFYERAGLRGAPVLLLSGSLGTTLRMWDAQVDGLSDRYDIIRYDLRGHGKSSTPAGPYTIDRLGGDVVALVERLEVNQIAFCGLSLGGAIGQWLALHSSERFRAFILANTASSIGTPALWSERIAAVEEKGMAGVAEGILGRWFTPAFHRDSPSTVERMRRMLSSCNPKGYVAACSALQGMDLRASIQSIHTPTCILAGEDDLVTTLSDAEFLRDNITDSKLVVLSAAHISNIEVPTAFNAAVLQFLQEQDSNG